MDTQTGAVSLHRNAYDVGEFQEKLKKLGWEESSIALLSRTK